MAQRACLRTSFTLFTLRVYDGTVVLAIFFLGRGLVFTFMIVVNKHREPGPHNLVFTGCYCSVFVAALSSASPCGCCRRVVVVAVRRVIVVAVRSLLL